MAFWLLWEPQGRSSNKHQPMNQQCAAVPPPARSPTPPTATALSMPRRSQALEARRHRPFLATTYMCIVIANCGACCSSPPPPPQLRAHIAVQTRARGGALLRAARRPRPVGHHHTHAPPAHIHDGRETPLLELSSDDTHTHTHTRTHHDIYTVCARASAPINTPHHTHAAPSCLPLAAFARLCSLALRHACTALSPLWQSARRCSCYMKG